jgi:hypothetical protein
LTKGIGYRGSRLPSLRGVTTKQSPKVEHGFTHTPTPIISLSPQSQESQFRQQRVRTPPKSLFFNDRKPKNSLFDKPILRRDAVQRLSRIFNLHTHLGINQQGSERQEFRSANIRNFQSKVNTFQIKIIHILHCANRELLMEELPQPPGHNLTRGWSLRRSGRQQPPKF